MDPDDRPKPKPGIVIGEDLAMLSLDELESRITTLEGEIDRIRKTVEAKRSSRDLAASAFKL
ncbi:MAG: DUF1192 domain-containing protein [Parvibaculaceae bacterium]